MIYDKGNKMARVFALLALGFFGLCFAGCGGGGDMAPPDVVPDKTPAQIAEEEAYNKETLKVDQ